MSSSLMSGVPVNATVVPGGTDDICALSPLQQEIFSDPYHANYIEQVIWDADLPLDGDLLKRSWSLLAQRHPVLRTLFRRARKQPVQVIRGAAQVSLALHNLKHESEEKKQQILEQVTREEFALTFDLAKGPLFRVSVFLLSDDSFKTLLTFHPILLDQKSVEVLSYEVSAIYAALLKNEAPPEQDAPAIKDFILWLKRQDSSEISRYREQCIKDAPITHFPTDHPQSSGIGQYTRRGIVLTHELTSAIKQLAEQNGATVLEILQAAWGLLLSRYTGWSKVTFGLAVDGRPAEMRGVERIAGMFAHTLPVTLEPQGAGSFKDLVVSLRQQAHKISRYGHLPFSQDSASGASSWAKLFNTVFTATTLDAETSTHTEFVNSRAADSVQIRLAVKTLQNERLQLAAYFHEDIFAPATIDSLLSSFLQLITGIASDPQGASAEFKILPENEQFRVLGFAQGKAVDDEQIWKKLGAARPASNAKVHVLEQQRLAPVNCLGEIAIGGLEADANEETGKWISDPFLSGGKLYLTGKQGRWKWDGCLELAIPTEAGAEETGATEGYIAPVTDAEKLVAQVWQEVLEVERVGLKDDFFDLGGHSLNTIQIRSRLSQRLGIDVPLKTIFTNTGLEAQARAIAALTAGPVQAESLIPRLPDRKHYPVSHAQRRLWFLHRLDPDDRFYHTADYIMLEGPFNRPAFDEAFHALVERQEILRTSFMLIADEPVQQISENTLSIPFHDLSALGQEEQSQEMKRLQDEVPKWLSNLEVPPVGALLVKLAEEKHVFILAIHHILSDEWSGQVVWRDLMEF